MSDETIQEESTKAVSKQIDVHTLFDLLYDREKSVPVIDSDGMEIKRKRTRAVTFEYHLKQIYKKVLAEFDKPVARTSQIKYALNEFVVQLINTFVKAVYDHAVKRTQTTIVGDSLLDDLHNFMSPRMAVAAREFAEQTLASYKESTKNKKTSETSEKRISQSERAGLIFPISTIERALRDYVAKKSDASSKRSDSADPEEVVDEKKIRSVNKRQPAISHTAFVIIAAVVEYMAASVMREIIARCIESGTSARYQDFMAVASAQSDVGDTMRRLNVMFRIPYGDSVTKTELQEILRFKERVENTKTGKKRETKRSINDEIAHTKEIHSSPYSFVRNTAIRGVQRSFNESEEVFPKFKSMANSKIIRLVASTTERLMIEYFKLAAPLLQAQGKVTLQEDLAEIIGKNIFSRMYNIRSSYLDEEVSVKFTKDAVKNFGKRGMVFKTSSGAKRYLLDLTRSVACTIYHNAVIDTALERRKTVRTHNVIAALNKMNIMMI